MREHRARANLVPFRTNSVHWINGYTENASIRAIFITYTANLRIWFGQISVIRWTMLNARWIRAKLNVFYKSVTLARSFVQYGWWVTKIRLICQTDIQLKGPRLVRKRQQYRRVRCVPRIDHAVTVTRNRNNNKENISADEGGLDNVRVLRVNRVADVLGSHNRNQMNGGRSGKIARIL